ncbi:hypothetical protein [Amycolatopsis sp. WAC 01416]|uniref:hypothetical protein n=1 Tax=Amycolatopsis sp. WAC 01416 TaxID=2203196 RepID=UPI000F76A940|nr:hypothetical protein [Amycolatopsis sp. WAC 01416]
MTGKVVRPAMWATIGGQAVAALGTILQWIAAPEFVKVVPAGLGYIAGALVILWLDRRAFWSPLAAIALTAWIFLGTGEMLGRQLSSPNTLLAAGNWVMVAGLVVSAPAGVIALVINRATATEPQIPPLSPRNPRRPLVITAVAALAAVEIGLGATQDFDLTRPGPSLFLALPVLVAVVPGRSMILLSAVMSAVFLEASFSYAGLGGRLSAPADGSAFALDVLQLAGMTVMVVVGAVAVGRGKRIDTISR